MLLLLVVNSHGLREGGKRVASLRYSIPSLHVTFFHKNPSLSQHRIQPRTLVCYGIKYIFGGLK